MQFPEIEGSVVGTELSHEAAVGKLAKDEIEYLMSRGLDEDEATATIIRGFLDVKIAGLPEALQRQSMPQLMLRKKQDFKKQVPMPPYPRADERLRMVKNQIVARGIHDQRVINSNE